MCLSGISIASCLICSQNSSYCVFAKNHCIWLILIQDMSKTLHSWNSITIYRSFFDCFPNLYELKLNCIVLKIFTDISRLCLSRNAIVSYRNIPERTQIVNWPIFISIWLKLFQGMSKFCLSQNSIATSRNCSQSFPKSVLANIKLQLIETITRYVQVLS